MSGGAIAGIVIASIVVAVGAAGCICYFLRRRKNRESTLDKDILVESANAVKYNARYIDVILVEASSETERNALLALQEKLRFLSPSLKKEVRTIDEELKAELEAVKARAEKGEGIGGLAALDKLLAERKLYTV